MPAPTESRAKVPFIAMRPRRITRSDRYGYECLAKDEDVESVTLLNRLTGELDSLRKAGDADPEHNFKAQCFMPKELKF